MNGVLKKYYGAILILLLFITGCGREKNTGEPQELRETNAETHVYTQTGTHTESVTEKLTAAETYTAVCLTIPVTTEQYISTETEPVLSNELSEYLEFNGYTFSDIENSEQVITVQSEGSSCRVRLFDNIENIWSETYDTYGIVGYNGVSENSREGSLYTPKGIFELGFAFGTEAVEGLKVDYMKITENSYWIDDPESEYYNQWVESDVISWNSAEHLIEYPQSYKYAVEIKYNMNPVIPYKGSAIFLHCAVGGYTAGCVAVPENDMRFILDWINKDKKPLIIIS